MDSTALFLFSFYHSYDSKQILHYIQVTGKLRLTRYQKTMENILYSNRKQNSNRVLRRRETNNHKDRPKGGNKVTKV